MNEHRTKKLQSIFVPAARRSDSQRRVSFSRTWSQTSRQLDRTGSSTCRAKEKSNPVPRAVSFSQSRTKRSESSILSNKGVRTCPSTRLNDVASPAPERAADARRRSAQAQPDPTPAHLKYGVFRRFSKFRRQSADTDSASVTGSRDRPEPRPILVARERSVTFKTQQRNGSKEHHTPKGPTCENQIPASPGPSPRHVHLCQTEIIHLDIKPKKFSSMLWC